MAKELMSRGEDLYFTQFNTLIDNFTAGWRDEEERHWFIRRVRNAGVLVVDDMGREGENRSIPMIEAMLDELVRHRVADNRPTLLTTNKDADWFRARYGRNVVSLLTETNEWVEVPGNDYRPRMLERLRQERALGLSRPVMVG
jgi:DNA replication protein DnaC